MNQNQISVAYDEREEDRRADKLAYLRSHQNISFVDTHFHMDRLQRKTCLIYPLNWKPPLLCSVMRFQPGTNYAC